MSDFDINREKAKSYLQRSKNNTSGHFIGGQWVISPQAETYTNVTPTDNSSLGDVVADTEEDINLACTAAEAAFATWRDIPGAQRKKMLNHFADKIEERAEEIAHEAGTRSKAKKQGHAL